MSESSTKLIYFPTRYILEWFSVPGHEIDWLGGKKDKQGMSYASYAKLGGYGDSAGVTPTPAVGEFLSLLGQTKDIFTQAEYADFCCLEVWKDWYERLTLRQRAGVRAKCFRNWYPSMIDSLHVWALLCEETEADCCYLDSFDDAVNKTDITVVVNGVRHKIAMRGLENGKSIEYHETCKKFRGDTDQNAFVVCLPRTRDRSPGNKRWYQIADFAALMESLLDTARRNSVQ